MKVLLIDVNCKEGSTGKLVYSLYTFLNNSGDESAICYGRGKKINEKRIFKFGLDWETYLHALLTRVTGFTGVFSFFSTKRLLAFIDGFKPDIVHIHELHAYFVNIAMLIEYLNKKNIPIVMTLHCEFAYTGKCGHAGDCNKWTVECGQCQYLKEYVRTLWFDHTKFMFNQKKRLFCNSKQLMVTTPSMWLASRVKKSFLKNRVVQTIHNSIDTDIFFNTSCDDIRSKYSDDTNTKFVLAVAPDLMSENKGGFYVVDVAKRFEKENIKFILIGDKEREPYVNGNIISLGCIYDRAVLAKYYSLANVFVICSKNENFPTTCIEALCCNTPVVGFDVGGVRETTPYNLGMFCQYGDINALEKNIREVLCWNTEQLPFDGVREYYNSKRMCEEYLSVYKKMVCEN